jgi:LL-diaminopimelate aminotransferase
VIFFDDKISDRLRGIDFGKSTEVYKVELIKQAKAKVKQEHPDLPLIDMGVGGPDWPADPIIVDTLADEAGKPETGK